MTLAYCGFHTLDGGRRYILSEAFLPAYIVWKQWSWHTLPTHIRRVFHSLKTWDDEEHPETLEDLQAQFPLEEDEVAEGPSKVRRHAALLWWIVHNSASILTMPVESRVASYAPIRDQFLELVPYPKKKPDGRHPAFVLCKITDLPRWSRQSDFEDEGRLEQFNRARELLRMLDRAPKQNPSFFGSTFEAHQLTKQDLPTWEREIDATTTDSSNVLIHQETGSERQSQRSSLDPELMPAVNTPPSEQVSGDPSSEAVEVKDRTTPRTETAEDSANTESKRHVESRSAHMLLPKQQDIVDLTQDDDDDDVQVVSEGTSTSKLSAKVLPKREATAAFQDDEDEDFGIQKRKLRLVREGIQLERKDKKVELKELELEEREKRAQKRKKLRSTTSQ